MKPIRHMVLGMALCGACCNLANGQNAGRLATVAPFRLESHETVPQLARLPLTTPIGLPGFNAFAGWYRSDVKLATDLIDSTGWGSGDATSLPPWRLLHRGSNGWSVRGSFDVGATANADNPVSRFNGPLTFNDRTGFQLNQLYLTVQRSSRTPCGRFDWGSQIDLLFGTDYVFAQSAGWETQPDGDNALNGLTTGNQNPDLYGLAIPQAFVELSHDQFNLRLGHFYTIVGYEGVAPTSNFFYSHTHALQYGEPLTHTGGLLVWTGQHMSIQGGVVNGWDKTDGVTDDATLLGGITFANRRSSLGLAVISGKEDGFAINGQRTMYSIVWQTAISDRLAYVLQHDLGYQRDSLGPNVDAQWYGLSQYLFYAISDVWKIGARFEWFRDDDGTRLSSMVARNGGLGLPAAGFAGHYYDVTLGTNWTPNANLTVRPEIRWDWSEGTSLAPYVDFTSDSQLTLAIDAVYIF
ncbi:MAG: outer membrane beta-barrel protein [Pirellulaceae bacterium]|jgi:hypothetical protein|nr:outer membrane beta-barrel protein [Pirellulaceae bacterium]